MSRQPTEWEKIFANDKTKERLISEIYKQHLQLNIKKKQTTQLKKKKNAQKIKYTFLQRHIKMARKHMERCST